MSIRELCLVLLVSCLSAQEADTTAAFTVEVTGDGPSVLLIPGLACGGDVWEGTVERLSEAYTCHVFTLAGFAGQPALEAPFLPTIRDALLAYIEEHGLDRPAVVGHSLGAFMALWLGCTAPDAIGPIVAVDGLPYYTDLVLPGADSTAVRTQAEATRDAFARLTREQFESQNELGLRWMITAPEDAAEVAKRSNASDPIAVGQAACEMMQIDLRSELGRLESRVLLFGATGLATDEAMRDEVEAAYRAQISEAPAHEVVFHDSARHFLQLDAPEFFFEHLERFLAGELGPPSDEGGEE